MHKSKKGVLIAVIVICALIALGACGYLVYKTISSDAEEKVYDNIASSFASNIDVEGTTAPKVDGTTKPEETKVARPDKVDTVRKRIIFILTTTFIKTTASRERFTPNPVTACLTMTE